MATMFAIPGNALASGSATVSYQTKLTTKGWQAEKSNGKAAGTSSKSKYAEGVRVRISGALQNGGISYRIKPQSKGWTAWKSDGAAASVGKGKKIDAIQIKLSGQLAKEYDVYYRTNVRNIGWMEWASNGKSSGSIGYGYGIQGLQVMLVEKGGDKPAAKVAGKQQNHLLAVTTFKPSKKKYKTLSKLGIKYSKSANKKVDKEMLELDKWVKKTYNIAFNKQSQLNKAALILTYVGCNFDYSNKATTAEGMIDKRSGTCFAYSDLVFCMARKAGLKQSYLTKAGRNVSHYNGSRGRMYGSQHRTVVCKIGGKWYDLDGNLALYDVQLYGHAEPEKITASYAKYLRGKSSKYTKIN